MVSSSHWVAVSKCISNGYRRVILNLFLAIFRPREVRYLFITFLVIVIKCLTRNNLEASRSVLIFSLRAQSQLVRSSSWQGNEAAGHIVCSKKVERWMQELHLLFPFCSVLAPAQGMVLFTFSLNPYPHWLTQEVLLHDVSKFNETDNGK